MTSAIEMPKYDGMEYEELVAAAQFLWMENAKLRELLTDYYNAPCVICNPWAVEHRCKHDEFGNCLLATRALELGIEEDE